MRQKIRLIIILFMIAALGLCTVGRSYAYYSDEVKSQVSITSAKFSINSDSLNKDGLKTIALEGVAPGSSGVYRFNLNKTGTEVPLTYTISVEDSRVLPLKYTLYKCMDPNQPNNLKSYGKVIDLNDSNGFKYKTNRIDSNIDNLSEYKIEWSWPATEGSNNYINLTDSFTVKVKAEQVIEDIIYAEVNTIDKNTSISSSGINKVISNESRLTIYNNDYFGDVSFDVQSGKLLSSTKRPEYNELDSWVISAKEGFASIKRAASGRLTQNILIEIITTK